MDRSVQGVVRLASSDKMRLFAWVRGRTCYGRRIEEVGYSLPVLARLRRTRQSPQLCAMHRPRPSHRRRHSHPYRLNQPGPPRTSRRAQHHRQPHKCAKANKNPSRPTVKIRARLSHRHCIRISQYECYNEEKPILTS